MGSLKGKKIVITGASRGIGESLAKKLAGENATLYLISRNITKNIELFDFLKRHNSEFYMFDADFSVKEEIERAYNFFSQKGDIDILINNAGRGIFSHIQDETAKNIREILDLNIFGLIYTTKLFTPSIVKNKGSIVNIASVAGRKGFAGLSVYCATKWAVVGFSESLREELFSKNVRVITVEPGLVDTEWGENLPDSFVNYKNSVDMLKSDDVAEAVIYALKQPDNVSINEILIRPTNQPR